MNPIVTSGPAILGKILPDDVRGVVRDILAASGVSGCYVTRTIATPKDQARAMYQNLIGTGDSQGITKQRELYKPPGNLIIDVYEQNASLPSDEIMGLMEKRIVEVGPELVSHHCGDPNKVFVLDIAPTSILTSKHAAFEVAAKNDQRVSKFLSPSSGDPAFHLEIPRQMPT